jgi:hypothetical protein
VRARDAMLCYKYVMLWTSSQAVTFVVVLACFCLLLLLFASASVCFCLLVHAGAVGKITTLSCLCGGMHSQQSVVLQIAAKEVSGACAWGLAVIG